MPVIRSAKKKLKVDKKRESSNKKTKNFIDMVVKKAQKKPSEAAIRIAFKAIDKGVKKDVFHKNKGARIKASLTKLISKKSKLSPKSVTSEKTKTKEIKKVK
jgi:small subunit ribosomal protein S20